MPFYNQNMYREASGPIDKEAEDRWFMFRFNDFKEEAQKKFVFMLKKDSSVKTLRNKAKDEDILHVLNYTNPIIVKPGWSGGFSSSGFYRWQEKILSSMIFNSLFRRSPRHADSWSIKFLLATPVRAKEELGREFVCRNCRNSFSLNFRSMYDNTLCRECYNTSIRRDTNNPWTDSNPFQTYAKSNNNLPKLRGRNRLS